MFWAVTITDASSRTSPEPYLNRPGFSGLTWHEEANANDRRHNHDLIAVVAVVASSSRCPPSPLPGPRDAAAVLAASVDLVTALRVPDLACLTVAPDHCF
jgi:hypothetical protein